MKTNQTVTVVTMTYKNFDYIFETIQSVLNQDYTSIEYIIADDGSGNFPLDEVKDYINLYKKKNITNIQYFIRDKNVGTVLNLEDAYRKSKGKILMPLSCGDTFLDETTVSKIVERFSLIKENVIATGRLVCNESGGGLYYYPHIQERKIVEGLFDNNIAYDAFISGYSYDMASGCALYIRKSFFVENGGFDKRFKLWEDGPYIEKVLKMGELEVVPEFITIRYRLGGISTGKKANSIMLKDIELFNQEIREKNTDNTSLKYKKLLKYSIQRSRCNTKVKTLFVYLQNIFPVFYRIKYLYNRRKALMKDITYLKSFGSM